MMRARNGLDATVLLAMRNHQAKNGRAFQRFLIA
jgi:hypothetical protein